MSKSPIQQFFRLRKACDNCPFRKEGAAELRPGRLKGIIDSMLANDHESFQCHKTVHNPRTGGEWDDDGSYQSSGDEGMCFGALAYLVKAGRLPVVARIAAMDGTIDPEKIAMDATDIIDPPGYSPDTERRGQ